MVSKVILLSLLYLLAQGVDSTNLITRRRPYRTNFTYALVDLLGSEIESMLDLTYVGEKNSFKSEPFSTETDPDVRCYFTVYYSSRLSINLNILSLPSNVAKILGVVDCGTLDIEGKKTSLTYFKPRKSVTEESIFQNFYYEKPINFDPQYRIYCNVDAVYLYKPNATNDANNLNVPNPNSTDLLNPTKAHNEKDEVFETNDKLMKTKTANSLECRKDLLRDTLKVLSYFNYTVREEINLKASNKKFKCLYGILYSRMPTFKLTETKTERTQDIVYDFGDELQPNELEALVDFMYWGMMNHWSSHCRVLFRIALKYGFECLKKTCEKVLMAQIKDINE